MTVIPLLYHHTKKDSMEQGVRFSAVGNNHSYQARGFPAKGLWIGGVYNYSGDFSGTKAGLFNASSDFKGAEVGLANIIEGEMKGVSIGAINSVFGKKDGVKLTGAEVGAVNYAKTNGRFALQIGVINYISEFNDKGTIVQIGFYNQAQNQHIPLLNIRRKKKSKLEEVVAPKKPRIC
jgi:hypothetical protein